MEVSKILSTLESDNSRLFKEKVLTDNKDNPTLKRVLQAALDPYTQYYQRKIPEYTRKEGTMSLDWALGSLLVLTSREETGNAAIGRLKNTLGRLSEDDAEVLKRVVSKDLKCGVSIATVNKVFGKDFISTYPCMLASAFNQKSFKAIKYPAIAQTKMDGMRANILINAEGGVEVRSRSGREIDLLGHFDEFVMKIFYKSAVLDDLNHFYGAVLDGELLVLDTNGDILDRKTGNGILNKAVKGTISEEEASRVRMWAWDMIPLENFKSGNCAIPYFDRLAVLNERMQAVYNIQEDSLVNILPAEMVGSYEEAEAAFNEALDAGEEGIIVKNGDSPWENKRSKYQVKMKAELEADLLVESIVEGSGKYQGLVGSLSCTSKDGSLKVNVGSGLTDIDRNKSPDEFIGKIISVKYNEKIKDKSNDTWSLFLPIFQELRLDKSEADNL
jgi:ATP-dependent DNA ligase